MYLSDNPFNHTQVDVNEVTFGKSLRISACSQGTNDGWESWNCQPPNLQGEERGWRLNQSPNSQWFIKHAYVMKFLWKSLRDAIQILSALSSQGDAGRGPREGMEAPCPSPTQMACASPPSGCSWVVFLNYKPVIREGGEEGNRGWDGWMASPTQWTWVWANSRRWWRTGKPDLLQSSLQRVGLNLATEQQQQPNSGASLGVQRQRICLPMQKMQVQSLGGEYPLMEEMATHSSILAWKIPWTEEPGGQATVLGGRKELETI